MRYLDSASGLPSDTLAAWLLSVDPASVNALRLQSGFFSADAVPYITPILTDLATRDGVVHIVVGSNQGATQRAHVQRLLDAAGPDRVNLRIGVVRFGNAFFHPKTVHLTLGDRVEAYVGSANFTLAGVGALHVEAGLLISNEDDADVVGKIAAAIDGWFAGASPELTVIDNTVDLRALVARGILSETPLPHVSARLSGSSRSTFVTRRPLLYPPNTPRTGSLDAPEGGVRVQIVQPVGALTWSKQISATDAQRKATGNQSGAISLVQARYPITPQTWFRDELFSAFPWTSEPTRTARVKEVATVPLRTRVLGTDYGELLFRVSHDPLRASGQGNYATLLHLGPLSDEFHSVDFTGRTLLLTRDRAGRLSLTIS